MNRYWKKSTSNLTVAFNVVGAIGIGLGFSLAAIPASAQLVQTYEQNVPNNSSRSFIYGSPIPTPAPIDSSTGLSPYNYNYPYYSYPASNFPPTVTYSYPNVGYYSYPNNGYYSFPNSGYYSSPGNNYYSYPNDQRFGNGYYPGSPVQLNPSSVELPRNQGSPRRGRF